LFAIIAGGSTIGPIASESRSSVRKRVSEAQWVNVRVGRASTGVDFELEPLVERLCAYALTIPDYRAGLKEWNWRNGWFHAEARRMNVAMPVNTALLEATGKVPP
jgi:hypothetical protein